MPSKPKIGTYTITEISTGRQYVGGARDVRKRWSKHRTDLRQNKHHSIILQTAWNSGIETNFKFEFLEICTADCLLKREQFYIDSLMPEFNISKTAGSCLGLKLSNETKAKITASLLGNKRTLGYKHTEETKAKQSRAHTGKKFGPMSDEHKINLSKALKGRIPYNKGIPLSDAQKQAISKANKGRKRTFTDEHRANLSKAMKGKPPNRWKNRLRAVPEGQSTDNTNADQT